MASGFLPQVQLPVPKNVMAVDSVIWFEHTDEGWVPWPVEFNHPRHTGLTVADINRDGRPDIVTAINTAWDVLQAKGGPSLEVWLNRGPH